MHALITPKTVPITRIVSLRRVTQGLFDHDGYISRQPTTPIGPIVRIQAPRKTNIPAHLESTFFDLDQDARLITCKKLSDGATRDYLVPVSHTFERFALPFGRETITIQNQVVTGTVINLRSKQPIILPHDARLSMHEDIKTLKKHELSAVLLVAVYQGGRPSQRDYHLAPVEAAQTLGI